MQVQSGKSYHPIYDELSHLIYRCKEKAEKQSLDLSKVLGVHKTTIWRWEQKLIKKRPQIEAIVKLLQFDSDIKDTKKLLIHFSALTNTIDYIRSKYLPLAIEEKTITNISNDDILNNFISYLAIKLCSTNEKGEKLEDIIEPLIHAQYEEFKVSLNGICKNTAINSLRPLILEHLDNLVKAGHLILTSEQRYKTPTDIIQWPFELTQKFLPKMFMFVNPENWKTTDYFTRGQSFSASSDDIAKAVRVFFSGYKLALEILSKSEGNQKVQLMAMFESLDGFAPPSSPVDQVPPITEKQTNTVSYKGEVH